MKKWMYALLALACYTVIALAMSWPLVFHMRSTVIGQGGDPWQTLWRFVDRSQALHQAIATHSLPSFIHTEFLGGGPGRLVNIAVWPWMPLHLLLGEPLAYNIVWLSSLILSGWAMYFLLAYLFANRPRWWAGALLGGLAYMFLPYRIAHALGHFGAMQTQWLPLLILAWLALLRSWRWQTAIALALLVIIQAWTDQLYTLWFGVTALIYLLFYWRDVRSQIQAHRLT